MEQRRFGRTGVMVPAVGMGTFRTFDVADATEEERCRLIVDECLQVGATVFDSSPMYGQAERVLGAALQGRRERAFVATKVWTKAPMEGRAQAEQALAYFAGRVDFYQVHNLVAWREQLAMLEELRLAGQARFLGVTHYAPAAFPELIQVMRTGLIDGVQIPYNALSRAVEAAVLPLAAELDLGVMIMLPLGGGKLSAGAPPQAALDELAAYGVRTWAQVLLKWVLSDPRVHVVIPATSRPGRMSENAAAGRPPWFEPEVREHVAELARRFAAG